MVYVRAEHTKHEGVYLREREAKNWMRISMRTKRASEGKFSPEINVESEERED